MPPVITAVYACSRRRIRGSPQRGISAIRETGGEVVAFLDDDVVVDGKWLVNLRKAFLREDVDIAGGRIVPAFEAPVPDWLKGREFMLGGFTYLERHGEVRERERIIGCNMAVRRRVFDEVGCFDEKFGGGSGVYPYGDESELLRRTSAHGCRPVYLDDVVVHHAIQKERFTKESLARLYSTMGLCQGAGRALLGKGAPVKSLAKLAGSTLRYLLTGRLRHRLYLSYRLGYIKGFMKERRRGSAGAGGTGRLAGAAPLPGE
ncbi:MAG: glycosyltransferase [Thermodesulfobacteriota bacterium]